MCEFCVGYGGGKIWYLQEKNYAKELPYEELSSIQKGIAKARRRVEWIDRFFDGFMMPTISGSQSELRDVLSYSKSLEKQLSRDEIVRRRKIEHFGQVLPIEDVNKVIDIVDSITRWLCGCRYTTTGRKELCCFGLGIDVKRISNKFPDTMSSFNVLEKEEAKEIICKYDEEGLIHTIWTSITPYITGLCNCGPNCLGYKEYIEERGPPSFFRAEYICQVDWNLCTGCKSCMGTCLFDALFYLSSPSKIRIDPIKCFGCGICRVKCPNGAITLLPRRKHPKAANIWLNGRSDNTKRCNSEVK